MNTEKLTEEEINWTNRSIEKGLERIEIAKILRKANYTDDKINKILEYYDAETKEEEKTEENNEKEDKFEENVKKYLEGNEKELGWFERRAVKKYIKQIELFSRTLEIAIKKFKQEMTEFNKKDWTKGRVETELGILKQELIKTLIDSKECLYIDHPKTGEEITKENMQDLSIDELITLLETASKELDMLVNGKITET